jgi:hypothetical protein
MHVFLNGISGRTLVENPMKPDIWSNHSGRFKVSWGDLDLANRAIPAPGRPVMTGSDNNASLAFNLPTPLHPEDYVNRWFLTYLSLATHEATPRTAPWSKTLSGTPYVHVSGIRLDANTLLTESSSDADS